MPHDPVESHHGRPLIAFIHVPKTSGTTVNYLLTQSGLLGQDHIQNWVDQPEVLKDPILSYDWVSGHLNPNQMRSMLGGVTSRPLRLFSTIRAPNSQIASHYNWLIEIFHKGRDFYDQHPERIKEISQSIRSADNANPAEVISQIKAAGWLFLNQQSRALLAKDASSLSKTSLSEILNQYEMITTEGHLSMLMQTMTQCRPLKPPHKNKSRYHFDPAVFQTPQLTEFLNAHNKGDQTLYDMIADQGGIYAPHLSPIPDRFSFKRLIGR